jgi:pyruvate ferredoxin oxidoreductase delta subunit
MVPYLEINNLCVSCDYCKLICPEKAILSSGGKYYVETWACSLCELCMEVCPVDAIKLVSKE